jgi:hypothetical protein
MPLAVRDAGQDLFPRFGAGLCLRPIVEQISLPEGETTSGVHIHVKILSDVFVPVAQSHLGNTGDL